MAPLMVLGGPSVAPYTVRGDHLFCHGQSGGTAFRGDRLSCDRSELRLFKNLTQSVRRLTNLRFRDFFVFTLSSFWSVFMDCYCIYGLSVSR